MNARPQLRGAFAEGSLILVGTDKVRSVVAELLEADRKPDGELRQNSVMRYSVATRPG